MTIRSVLSHGVAQGLAIYINVNNDNKIILDEKEAIKSFNKALTYLINKYKKYDDEYFKIQRLMLEDKYLYKNVLDNLKQNNDLITSITFVIDTYIKSLDLSNNQYLRERIPDLENLKTSVINAIFEVEHILSSDAIVCCEEIYPTFLLENKKYIKGIICKKGGYLSHSAILARNLEIPYIIVDDYLDIVNKKIVFDTRLNIISVDLKNYKIKKVNKDDSFNEELKSIINVYANIFGNEELDKIDKYNFSGVGLYRTEFIFMNSDEALNLDKQITIYKKAAYKLKNKSIIFRTFDLGDDKKVSYLNLKGKGYLNYINNLDVFKTQVKALCYSNKYNNLGIMFPMIRNVVEYNNLKDIVIDIVNENGYNMPKIGIMLETKDAYYNLDTFKEVDFISIGTNDLTKELFNVDREHLDNVDLYLEELYKVIKKVKAFCDKENIKLSICGEVAGVEEVALKLMNIGIENISIAISSRYSVINAYKEFIKDCI